MNYLCYRHNSIKIEGNADSDLIQFANRIDEQSGVIFMTIRYFSMQRHVIVNEYRVDMKRMLLRLSSIQKFAPSHRSRYTT